MRAPTGQQFTIGRRLGVGQAELTVTELAAGIRGLTIDGVVLVEPFAESASPPMGCGIVLVPWANRVRDGAWLLGGERQQLDLTDPGNAQATHGLLRNTAYRVVEHEPHAITLGATVFPQHGYPFLLDTTVRYELEGDGLAVTHEIHNASDAAAPAAIGAHPYFRIGDVPIAELTLTVGAGSRFELDEKLLPTRQVAVDGDFDLRGGRLLGDIDLNVALGDLEARDGVVRSTLEAPDGRVLEVWQEAQFAFVQVYTPRNFPKDGGKGLAVAIEPMTAAPDALNNGLGLRWIEPGETWSARWGIRYAGAIEGE